MAMRILPELRHLAKRARRAGWTIAVDGQGHQRWTSPDGKRVTVTLTRWGGRDRANTLANLKRAGLDTSPRGARS